MPDCSQESGKESSEECGKESGKDGANNRIEVSSKHFPCLHFSRPAPRWPFFYPITVVLLAPIKTWLDR